MKKYDSKFEEKFHKSNPDLEFHPAEKIEYVVPAKYEIDFKYVNSTGKVFLIELKGRFRTSTEASKYKHIRSVLDSDSTEIIFVFQKPNVAMPNAKKRKDGTKQTQEEWATKNGFRYFYTNTLKLEEL